MKKEYFKCNRCGKKDCVVKTSWFNTDTICLDCSDIEHKHPDFKNAHDTEIEHVLAGNYNFEGIGLPDNYEEFASKIRKKLNENR